MSTNTTIKRKTIRDIAATKGTHPPLVCLTAYTAPMARMLDAHVDVLLVGDSLGMVLYGMDSTLPVTLDMMINHGKAVMRGSDQACVVVDMPFGSYQESPAKAFKSAAKILQRTGAAAVKLEGGTEMAGTIKFLTERAVPVMGHVGLQPQSVQIDGGYKVKGYSAEEEKRIIKDAKAVEDAGAFALVIEGTTPELAKKITKAVKIPTIGIGASPACDGQILVSEDMLGLLPGKAPKFVKPFAALAPQIEKAAEQYAEEVRARTFPAAEQLYKSRS